MAHIYLIPGVFRVTLQSGGKKIAATIAYIRSDKWVGLGFHRQRDLPNHYYEFPAIKTGSDSLFHINNSQLFKMGLDTTGPVITRLCNFTPVGHYSDDFIFETRFKNNLPDKGMYCRSVQFQISGMNNIIRFKLVSTGCSIHVLNVISEHTFDGAKLNLSRFVTDLQKWNTVKMINQHKQVFLYVNNKLLFKGAYQNTIGDIKGLFFEFEGTGFVKYCSLKSNDGKILYHF